MKHVEVGPDGARLGYVELDGEGPALVYLHGLGSCSPAYFTRSAAEPGLVGRRVLMIDFLGFGLSDRPLGFGYTLEDHADAIARGLDALGVSGADVVAHSMGGGIAVVLADRRPDLVGRLLLAEPTLRPSARPLVESFTEDDYVAHGFQQELDAVGPQWAATMRLADPVAMYRSETALGTTMTPLLDVLTRLPMPRAIIAGEVSGWLGGDSASNDSAFNDATFEDAGIGVHVVAGATHVMMLENPVGFARAITDALGELSR